MDTAFEYAKQQGPFAVQLFVIALFAWRVCVFLAREVVKPLVGVTIEAVPAVAQAAVKMQADVADVKAAAGRIEARQEQCCGRLAGAAG